LITTPAEIDRRKGCGDVPPDDERRRAVAIAAWTVDLDLKAERRDFIERTKWESAQHALELSAPQSRFIGLQ